MKKNKRRRRTISASSKASRKGWRTRRRMIEQRAQDSLDHFRAQRHLRAQRYARQLLREYGPTLDDMLPPEQTINRIPKVEWT